MREEEEIRTEINGQVSKFNGLSSQKPLSRIPTKCCRLPLVLEGNCALALR